MAEDDSKAFERASGAAPPVSSSKQQTSSQRSNSSQQPRSIRQDRAAPDRTERSTERSPLPKSRTARETIPRTESTPATRARGVGQNRAPWGHPSPIPTYPTLPGSSPYSSLEPSTLPPTANESEPNALPLPPNAQYQASTANLYESSSLTSPYSNMGTSGNPTLQSKPLSPNEYYTPSAATPSRFNNTYVSSQGSPLGNLQESSTSTYQDALSHGQLSPPPQPPPQPPLYLSQQPGVPLMPGQDPAKAQNKKPAIDSYHRPSNYPPPHYPPTAENQGFPSIQDTRPQPTFLPSQRPMYNTQPGPPAYNTNPPPRPSESNGRLSTPRPSSDFQNPAYPPQNDTSSTSSEDTDVDRSRLPYVTSVKLPMYSPEPYTPTGDRPPGQGQYQSQSNEPDSNSYSSPKTPPYGLQPTTLPSDPVLSEQAPGNQGPSRPAQSNLNSQGVGYVSQASNANPSVRYSCKSQETLTNENSFSIPEPPAYNSNVYPSENYASAAQPSLVHQGSQSQPSLVHQGSQSQPQSSSVSPTPAYVPEGYPGKNDNLTQKQSGYQDARPPSHSARLSHASGYEPRPFTSAADLQPSRVSGRPEGIQGSTKPPIRPLSSQNPGSSTDMKLPMSTPYTPLSSAPRPYPSSSSFQTPTRPYYQPVPSGKLPPPISQRPPHAVNGQFINQGLQGTPKPAQPQESTYFTQQETKPQVSYGPPSTPQIHPSAGQADFYPPTATQAGTQYPNHLPSENTLAQAYAQQHSFGSYQDQGTLGMHAAPNATNMQYYKNPVGQQHACPSYGQPGGHALLSSGQGQPHYPPSMTAMSPGQVSQPQANYTVPNYQVPGVPVMVPINDSTQGFGRMNAPNTPLNATAVPARPARPNMPQFGQPSPPPGGPMSRPVYEVPNEYATAASHARPMPPSHPPQDYNFFLPEQGAYNSFQQQGTGLYNPTDASGYTVVGGPPNNFRPQGSGGSMPSARFQGNRLGNPVPMGPQNMAHPGAQPSGTNVYQMPPGPPVYMQQQGPNGRWNSGPGNQGQLYEHFQQMLHLQDQSKL